MGSRLLREAFNVKKSVRQIQAIQDRQATARILNRIDNEAIVSEVVSELDSEYGPMDNSFDRVTAERAARMALGKLVEVVNPSQQTSGAGGAEALNG